jgi:uncharacterized membrane protein (UPF0127 family)
VILAAVLVLAGCATDGGVDEEFRRAEVVVGGQEWDVAIADTPALRSRGLQGVADLGELEGMLFVFATDTTSAFTMRGTVMAIDIAFFAASGDLVDVVEMVPCRSEPCPLYRARGPYRYALETEAGALPGVEGLELDPASVPED